MSSELPRPPGFWKTVGLLLGAARKRSAGRRKRQQELMNYRARKSSMDLGSLGFALAVLFMFLINGLAAFVLHTAVSAGQSLEAKRQGKILVRDLFLNVVNQALQNYAKADDYLSPYYASEASKIAEFSGGSQVEIEQKLREAVRKNRSRGFVKAVSPDQRIAAENQGQIAVSQRFLMAVITAESSWYNSADQRIERHAYTEAGHIARDDSTSKAEIEQKLLDSVRNNGTRDLVTEVSFSQAVGTKRFSAMLGSLVLFWWAVMLVFQGEGLELDLQRRRHPMWEWLFSHPVRPGAVFFSEMLSPLAANPIYWGAPLFVGILYGFVYDIQLAFLAAFLIGIPVSIATACLGKALEIGTILRFSPRTRGAVIGVMGWLGYASMVLLFLSVAVIPKATAALGPFLGPFTLLPWFWLRLFLGVHAEGSSSFLFGALACWLFAGLTIAVAVRFSIWGAQRGLAGNFAAADLGPSRRKGGTARFGREPLYRKEFLWFIRDRSAIVQVILVPLTIASVQVFNLRGLLSLGHGAWNFLCGIAILFGTYFLWVLGPKSLTSEGSALWIALTWPLGLESLLKAKAWLWSLVSSVIVALVLCYAAFTHPESLLPIVLVGVGWFFFGRSMAEKTVTLVTITSSSGEPEKVPKSRQFAASLGMLTFAVGVLTQQWHIAVMGIVYSYITAAAMWQNFRARLPYLYDPWSEQLPPPPTLMHAMVAISILVEAGAVITGVIAAIAGRENMAMAQAISYGLCAVIVSVGVWHFLDGRDVSLADVCRWPQERANVTKETLLSGDGLRKSWPLAILAGAVGGLLLGLFAHGYLFVLRYIPAAAELLRKSQEEMAKIPNLKVSFAVMAVVFAPLAEEYLFRGLLYRALDREWGGWRAVVGSAAFFAIYHAPLSWLPVALLGACNAILFKKTGRIESTVVLHMVYNAVVVFST